MSRTGATEHVGPCGCQLDGSLSCCRACLCGVFGGTEPPGRVVGALRVAGPKGQCPDRLRQGCEACLAAAGEAERSHPETVLWCVAPLRCRRAKMMQWPAGVRSCRHASQPACCRQSNRGEPSYDGEPQEDPDPRGVALSHAKRERSFSSAKRVASPPAWCAPRPAKALCQSCRGGRSCLAAGLPATKGESTSRICRQVARVQVSSGPPTFRLRLEGRPGSEPEELRLLRNGPEARQEALER